MLLSMRIWVVMAKALSHSLGVLHRYWQSRFSSRRGVISRTDDDWIANLIGRHKKLPPSRGLTRV